MIRISEAAANLSRDFHEAHPELLWPQIVPMRNAIRQIISRAVAPEGVIDIFAAAGLHKPDISILSDEFLSEVRHLPQRNLAVELLQKLLRGGISARAVARMSFRPVPLPRCWSRLSAATTTAPSRQRR